MTFLIVIIITAIAAGVGLFAHNSLLTGKTQLLDKQAFYIAEAGRERARQALVAGTWSGGNTYTESFGAGEYKVTISGSSPYTITSEGYVPNQTATVASRQAVESGVTSFTNLSRNPNVIAFASSSNGTNTPDKAKDGLTTNQWRANTNGSGSWLAMDFQVAAALNQIIIREDANITSLTIEWSDDNSTWTVVSGLSITTTGSGNSEVYTASFTAASHRYFRSRFTGVPGGSKAAVKEMETYNTGSIALGQGTFTTAW